MGLVVGKVFPRKLSLNSEEKAEFPLLHLVKSNGKDSPGKRSRDLARSKQPTV